MDGQLVGWGTSMELPTRSHTKTNAQSQTLDIKETVHHVWAEVEGHGDNSKDS